jgi:hypothetical protein
MKLQPVATTKPHDDATLDALKSYLTRGTVEPAPSEPTPPAAAATAPTLPDPAAHAALDAMTLTLLAQLDEAQRTFLQELAYIHNRLPVWALVVGAVQRCFEDATIASPVLPPMVRRLCEGYRPPQEQGLYTCEHCHHAFIPKRWRQRFCSNDCGAAFLALVMRPKAIA